MAVSATSAAIAGEGMWVPQQLPEISAQLKKAGLKLDPRLSLIGLAGIAALLAVGVVFYLWRDQGSFRPLYGAGEAYPAAEVMQVLDADAVQPRPAGASRAGGPCRPALRFASRTQRQAQ